MKMDLCHSQKLGLFLFVNNVSSQYLFYSFIENEV